MRAPAPARSTAPRPACRPLRWTCRFTPLFPTSHRPGPGRTDRSTNRHPIGTEPAAADFYGVGSSPKESWGPRFPRSARSRVRCGGVGSDRDRDRSAALDGTRHRTEAVVRDAHRPRQHLPRGVACLAGREPDGELDPEVVHLVSGLVLDLLAAHSYLELIGLGAPAGRKVDVDRGTSAQRCQEKLHWREAGVVATAADRERAAAAVAHEVPAGAGALEVHRAERVISHGGEPYPGAFEANRVMSCSSR